MLLQLAVPSLFVVGALHGLDRAAIVPTANAEVSAEPAVVPSSDPAPALVPAPASAATAAAHEIPVTVLVQAFLRPEGDVLRVLVRAPLNSMRDFNFPTRGEAFFLNIAEAQPMLLAAARLWLVDYVRLYEEDTLLTDPAVVAAQTSLPSDPSFESYETALAHILGPPLPQETDLVWTQAMMDVLIEYPIESADSRFSIDSEWAHLGISTSTVLRFQLPGSEERLFQFTGVPGLVRLDPSWFQAAARFVLMGFLHILDGIDHLLFIFCLVIPFRRIVPLLAIITSFTIAHSITLIASAFGYAPNTLWFPPLVEALIAVSILFMALENIVGAELQRRWLVAFGFGLVHGFGFSFALRESLQLAGAHLTTSLFSFNVGVEFGQMAVLVLIIPALAVLFRWVMAERIGVILLSALVAHTAWHWTTARWETFRAYPLELPAFNLVFLLTATRWLTAILILVGIVWGMYNVFGRFEGLGGKREPEAPR